MAADFEVRGAEELRALGAALKGAEKPVRKATIDALKKAATGDLQDAVRAAADSLPSGGGLAARMAAVKIAPKVRLSGRQAGVRLVGRVRGIRAQLEVIDAGRVRHPLFGDRAYWFAQSVLPGWWSTPITARAPRIREDLAGAVGDAVKTLVRE